MDKFGWQEAHANPEQCYLLERKLVSNAPAREARSIVVTTLAVVMEGRGRHGGARSS
jgi:hypothetical protein